MKITKDYILIAENAMVDARHRATIINTFDTIYAKKLPAIQNQLTVICALVAHNAKAQTVIELDFEIISPKLKSIANQTIKQIIEKDEEKAGINLVVNAPMMPIHQHGEYVFRFKNKKDGKIIAERSLQAIESDPPNSDIEAKG